MEIYSQGGHQSNSFWEIQRSESWASVPRDSAVVLSMCCSFWNFTPRGTIGQNALGISKPRWPRLHCGCHLGLMQSQLCFEAHLQTLSRGMCWLIFLPRNETVSPLLLPGFLFFRMNFSFLYLKLDYHNLTVLKFQMSFLFLANEQDSLQFKIGGGSFSNILLGVSRQHLLIIGLLESNLINKGRIWRSTVVHCWWECNLWIALRNVNWYSLLEGNLNLQGISVRIKKAWTL